MSFCVSKLGRSLKNEATRARRGCLAPDRRECVAFLEHRHSFYNGLSDQMYSGEIFQEPSAGFGELWGLVRRIGLGRRIMGFF